jgi:holdfast attachment protein HfaA
MSEADLMSKANPADPPEPRPASWGAALLTAAAVAAAGGAQAQGLSNNGGSFNAGYGGSSAMNQAIDVSTRDENQNTVFVNGVMRAPAGSVFARSSGFAQQSSSGVGGTGLATAIGNNLNVVVNGSYNVVTVDSTQINNGDVSANVSLNGQVNLDGP